MLAEAPRHQHVDTDHENETNACKAAHTQSPYSLTAANELGTGFAFGAGGVACGGIRGAAAAPSAVAAAVAAACAPAAAMGGIAGAAASLLSSPDQMEALLMPPEVTGAFQAFRLARPILLTLAGTLPVLAARAADGAGGSPVAAATAATAAVAVGFSLVTVWLWKRDTLQAALRAQVARVEAGQS